MCHAESVSRVPDPERREVARRALGSAGAAVAALSIALAAYAAHGAGDAQRDTLQLAAVLALVHGVALVVLAPRPGRRLGLLALGVLLLGTLLFAGSIALADLAGIAPRLAPVSGALLALGWLLHAIEAWRS
ncbi:hypothetical protein GCM10023332_14330 [Luteimonas vadosa]|uniref:DUF423 domain-containing protein n=1 Tax=Luteimonas vadosa TaxID=1165507 RepID=A0ABP9DZZ8_9GAMM